MSTKEIKDYLKTATMDEVHEIAKITSARIVKAREDAKRQFSVGDSVTSDNERWVYGIGEIIKINVKYIIVKTRSGNFKVPPVMLKLA